MYVQTQTTNCDAFLQAIKILARTKLTRCSKSLNVSKEELMT